MGYVMKKKQATSNLDRRVDNFLEANHQIKDALKLFKISEEQYLRAIQSTEPQPTTSTNITIEIGD
jgi:hypothetical protein